MWPSPEVVLLYRMLWACLKAAKALLCEVKHRISDFFIMALNLISSVITCLPLKKKQRTFVRVILRGLWSHTHTHTLRYSKSLWLVSLRIGSFSHLSSQPPITDVLIHLFTSSFTHLFHHIHSCISSFHFPSNVSLYVSTTFHSTTH